MTKTSPKESATEHNAAESKNTCECEEKSSLIVSNEEINIGENAVRCLSLPLALGLFTFLSR